MSNFTDALEPTKKGILTKARENYNFLSSAKTPPKQAKGLNALLTDVKESHGEQMKRFILTELKNYPEHLRDFALFHQRHMQTGFYCKVLEVFNDAERDKEFPVLLCRYGQHLIKKLLSEMGMSDKKRYYDALDTLLDFLGK